MKDINLQAAFELAEEMRAKGLGYYTLSVMPVESGLKFGFYTPQTGHFYCHDYAELMGHMERLNGEGIDSIALALAMERRCELAARISGLSDDMAELDERITEIKGRQP